MAICKLPKIALLSLSLSLSWWDTPNRLKQLDVIEPVQPLHGDQIQGFLREALQKSS